MCIKALIDALVGGKKPVVPVPSRQWWKDEGLIARDVYVGVCSLERQAKVGFSWNDRSVTCPGSNVQRRVGLFDPLEDDRELLIAVSLWIELASGQRMECGLYDPATGKLVSGDYRVWPRAGTSREPRWTAVGFLGWPEIAQTPMAMVPGVPSHPDPTKVWKAQIGCNESIVAADFTYRVKRVRGDTALIHTTRITRSSE